MIETFRRQVVKALSDYTKVLVVDSDNPNKEPNYPYISFKITSLRIDAGEAGVMKKDFPESLDPRFKYDYRTSVIYQPYMILSVQAYDKDLVSAQVMANKAYEWFKHDGYMDLKDINVVVVDVGDVKDRSVSLGPFYEYRAGFDVRFRYLQEIERRDETIETWSIKKGDDY